MTVQAWAVTANERIVAAAWDVIRGDAPEPTDKDGRAIPGMCLAQVRIIIERAFYGGHWRFYDLHRTIIVDRDRRASVTPYARDIEASLREQGMALTLPRYGPPGAPVRYVNLEHPDTLRAIEPGDLLFKFDTARDKNGVWIGHVAVAMPGGLQLENVANRAGALRRGPLHLSRLGAWPVTTVVRYHPPA